MKIFLAVFFVVFQSISSEEVDKENAVKECISELSINADVTVHFKEHGELPDETNKNAMCFFQCLSKKIGLTDDAGDIDKDKVIAFAESSHPELSKEEIDPVTTLCAQRTESDVCEKWYEFTKCLIKAFMEMKTKPAE